MRETQLQTPQRDQPPANRRPKSNSDTSKKSTKLAKKSLNFSDAPGESDDNFVTESVETVMDSSNPANTPLPLSVSASDFSPSSTITTAGTQDFIDSSSSVNMPLSSAVSESDLTPSSSITFSGTKVEGTGQTVKSEPLKITSVESELAVKHLKQSMVQVLKSRDIHSRSKKVLDAVVNAVIEDLNDIGISDDAGFKKLTSTKAAVVLLNFLGVITAIWFFISGPQRAPFGPTPT